MFLFRSKFLNLLAAFLLLGSAQFLISPSPAQAAGTVITNDGSSTSGWNVSGVTILGSGGNPGSVLAFSKNDHISRSYGTSGSDISGTVIQLDAYFTSTQDFIKVMWGANAACSGAGGLQGVFGPATNTGSGNFIEGWGGIQSLSVCMYGASPDGTIAGTGSASVTGGNWSINTWYTIKVVIGPTSTSYYVNGVLIQTRTTALPTNNYIFLGGDDRNGWGFSNGVLVDNISIGTTATTSFTSSSSPSAGSPVTLSASVSPSAATGSVTFKDGSNNTLCTVSSLSSGVGSCNTWTPSSSGTYAVTAYYSGDSVYLPANSASSNIVVAAGVNIITFPAISSVVFGGAAPSLSATASSGLTVSYTSSTLSVCTVSGAAITILSVGTCTITGSQAGNDAYASATTVSRSFNIYSGSISGTANYGQTLTASLGSFTPNSYSWLRSSTSGGTYSAIPSATSSTYILTGADVGNYIKVSMISVDTVTVTTSPTAKVVAISQTLTFAALASAKITFGTVTLGVTSGDALATSTSGLSPTYTTSSTAYCSVTSSGVVTLLALGTCAITANQAGNSGYGAATPVTQNLVITADVPGAPLINSVSTGGGAGATSGTATVKFTDNTSNGAAIDSYTVTATGGISPISQVFVAGPGTNTGTLTGLTIGTPYTVSVKAHNSAGFSLSTSYGSTVTPASAPYAVTELTATQSGAGQLTINFTPPISLNGGTGPAYQYFITPHGSSFPGTPTHIETTTAGSTAIPADPGHVFTGLTPLTAYDVQVVVATSANSGSLSASTAILNQIPAGAPTSPIVSIAQTDSQSVTVAWKSAGDNGSAITSFTAAVTADGATKSCTFSFNAAGSSCPITGLSGGMVISASVTANNGIGMSSIPGSAAPLTIIGQLNAPSSLVGSPGNGSASIAFTQVTNGDSVIYYQYSLDGTNFIINSATTSPVTIAGLTNGVAYSIFLIAVGSTNGASPISVSVSVTPVAAAIAAAPVVNQVARITSNAPVSGPTSAGTLERLSGTFALESCPIANIMIDNVFLTQGSWIVSNSALTFTMPAHKAGAVEIKVYNSCYPMLTPLTYLYEEPQLALPPTTPATPTSPPAVSPPPVKDTPAPAASNVQPTPAMKKISTFTFGLNSYYLYPSTKSEIAAVAKYLLSQQVSTILVYGNTDSQPGINNSWLSKQRALSVAEVLRPLLKGKTLRIGWYAATKPAVVGSTKAAYAANRRVEIWIK